MMQSLGTQMGYDIANLLTKKDLQFYACKDKKNLKWGVLFQPNSKFVLSWNSAL